MMEEILPNLFRITVPLPDHALKSVNSYVITAPERTLVIDTGWNRLECVEALLHGLDELGVDRSRTDLFLTHFHADHAGLAGLFAAKGSAIFCGQNELALMDHYINTSGDKNWPALRALAKPHGFPPAEMDAGIEAHAGNRYAPDRLGSLTPVKDGDILTVGDYQLRCLATPGHTPGHMSLYEPASKFLLSGDHLLGGFSPTISQWGIDEKGLASYLASLDRLAGFDISLVLPGHWSEFTDSRTRVRKTQAFHQARNAEITTLFADGKSLTTYQAASSLSWNGGRHAWVFFPFPRKWSATADTLAHLCYLRDHGSLEMTWDQGMVRWSRRKPRP